MPKPLSTTDQAFIDDAWKKFQQAENERLHLCVEKLSAALLCVLDATDYTTGACSCTEMVGAVLDKVLIKNAREAIRFPDRANRPTLPEGEMEKVFAEKRLERAAPQLLAALKGVVIPLERLIESSEGTVKKTVKERLRAVHDAIIFASTAPTAKD